MCTAAVVLLQNGLVRSNLVVYNIITAAFHSQVRRISPIITPQTYCDLTESLLSFNRLVESIPVPRIREFNHILIKIARMKQYSTAISLILDHDMLGFNSFVKPDLYTFGIAINCFCHMDRLGEVGEAHKMVELMLERGEKPDTFTYTSLV
ncbi:hypothetical protein L6452_21015 [Arctium lappa]|uniref:Uncharacterized protein n=1 Tax=Arctium lappa TaxID=4217 RepID=A0ACB9BDS0_ARCLA|nr:hypothetical protein L6452_21015 [Arctium lappa]